MPQAQYARADRLQRRYQHVGGMYPHDAKTIGARLLRRDRRIGGVGSGRQQGTLASRLSDAVEWRHDDHRGQSVVQAQRLASSALMRRIAASSLWAYPTQSGIMAGAATFTVKGQQYVAVLTGRAAARCRCRSAMRRRGKNVPNLPRLLVFRWAAMRNCRRAARRPAGRSIRRRRPRGPSRSPRACNCSAAIASLPRREAGGGGVLPVYSARGALANADAWKSILIDGALAKDGMVSFAKVMSPEQAQLIRLYVIDEANWAKKNLLQGPRRHRRPSLIY